MTGRSALLVGDGPFSIRCPCGSRRQTDPKPGAVPFARTAHGIRRDEDFVAKAAKGGVDPGEPGCFPVAPTRPAVLYGGEPPVPGDSPAERHRRALRLMRREVAATLPETGLARSR